MEVRDVVKETLLVLEECSVPDDLREVAFTKVFDSLREPFEEANPVKDGGESDDLLGRIAGRLETTPESVMGVFYEDDGDLALGVSSSKLNTSVARATKEIALLVAAGRQASGLDEDWTPVDTIREVCRDYKKLDPNNFASTVTEMDDVFNFRGKGKQRAVRVAKPGWSKVAQLIEALAGGDLR